MAEKKEITIRLATRKDVPLILEFIKKLATYEGSLHRVSATEELLNEWMFDKKSAEVAFALVDGKEVGFLLFYECFAAFLGRTVMYIGEFFVEEEYRGYGCGDKLFKYIAELGLERGCSRVEWCCFDWNESSVGFYMRRGAAPIKDCSIYRLGEAEMKKVVE